MKAFEGLNILFAGMATGTPYTVHSEQKNGGYEITVTVHFPGPMNHVATGYWTDDFNGDIEKAKKMARKIVKES